MDTYTVNVSGGERHDGEKPYTYALKAKSLQDAKVAAWMYQLWFVQSECGTVQSNGVVAGHTSSVDDSLSDADVVVTDCPEFPCHPGIPLDCADPCHFRSVDWGSCRCTFVWRWIYHTTDASPPEFAVHRLVELGYDLSFVPEETVW